MMKTKIILVLMLLHFGQAVRPQGMPVYDNTNFLALGKSLIESAKQTSQLLKTVRFLKAQKQRIEQVSSVIKQLRAVKEITQNHQRLFEMVENDLREILNSPFIRPEEVERVSRSFNSIIEIAVQDLNFMQQVLTSNFLEMTDWERLEILEAQRLRSRKMVAEIALKKKRYRTIISFREIKSRINNREALY
ncbi:MAG TPA: conjugal transfer protein [Salinimicrobium sp.]|nr:conjugal transfer protein [Salinimicrobium sp.]